MKMKIDHLPLMESLLTSTNLPLWKAWVLNGTTAVLMRDISCSKRMVFEDGMDRGMKGRVRMTKGKIECPKLSYSACL